MYERLNRSRTRQMKDPLAATRGGTTFNPHKKEQIMNHSTGTPSTNADWLASQIASLSNSINAVAINNSVDTLQRLDFHHVPQCEGSNHPNTEGHSDGPAEYVIGIACPKCSGYELSLLCCGSRMVSIALSECTMTCPRCGVVAGWESFWRSVIPIEIVSGVSDVEGVQSWL